MKGFRFWKRLYMLPLLLVLAIAVAACGPEADATPTPMDETGALPGDPLPPVEVDPTVVVDPTVDLDPDPLPEDVDEMTPTATVMATEPVETPQVTEPADVITGTPEAMLPHERVALVRSNDLVGVNIINRADEVIARVEDVLFDEDGEIHYVVLNVYNEMGQTATEDYYAVTWDDFAISRDDDFTQTGTLTGTGSQAEAQAATQTGFETGVLLYEEDAINLTRAVPIDDSLLESDDIFYSTTADDDVDTQMLDGLFRLSAFARFRLFNPDLVNPERDEDLGVVEDMLVNVDEGVVQYTVAEIGGWLGIGRTAVIIPWERIAYDEEEEQFLINATEEELEDAPALDLDQLNQWEIDPEWERETERYWTTQTRN